MRALLLVTLCSTTMACRRGEPVRIDAAPPSTAAQALPDLAPDRPVSDGAPPLEGWYRVTTDSAVLVHEFQDDPDSVNAFLGAGQLIELHRETRPGVPPTVRLKFAFPGGRKVDLDGPVVPGKLADFEPGWVWPETLAPPPVPIPPRDLLCGALAAAKPPTPAADCAQSSRFVLLDRDAGPPRFLATFSRIRPGSHLQIIDLQGPSGPVVTGSVPNHGITILQQAALPGGRTLLAFEEPMPTPPPQGPMGTGFGFAVVQANGTVARDPTRPLVTTAPKGPRADQVSVTMTLERTPEGPLVHVRGIDGEQEIATGRMLSTRQVATTYSWDSRASRWSARPASR